MTDRYDIVIIGGGMVGATLACALQDTRYRVAIIEGGPLPGPVSGPYDLRVSAITQASRQIFTSLGAWEGIQAQRVSPFREMHVWDAQGEGEIHFDSADIGTDLLGHIIENRAIQYALIERIQQSDNIDILSETRLKSFTVSSDVVYLELENGAEMSASLLVGADGRDSRVRELAGISTKGWAYDQHAVVTTVKPELFHNETAWQRFLPDGPLAFLPLNEGYCSIVWSTQPGHAAELIDMPEQAFCEALSEAFEFRLGSVQSTDRRASFPLRLQHSTQYVKGRIALMGDAAHAIHPLAGQGVNLGLLDAAVLAENLMLAQEQGKDPGDYALLRKYERSRKGDNLGMMFAMDGFKKLFGSKALPVKMLRNFGLRITDSIQPVKNIIIQNAMGLRGELPALARPGKHKTR